MAVRAPLSLRLSLLLCACGGDGFGPPDDSVAGGFVLQSVNGRNLPATVAGGGGERYIIKARLLWPGEPTPTYRRVQ